MNNAATPARSGALMTAGAQVINGISAYGFLVLAARGLGDDRFAPVSIAWAMQFLIGSGLFISFEQEGTRAVAAARARGGTGDAETASVARLFGRVLLATIAVLAILGGIITRRLLDGEVAVFAALTLGIIGFAVTHVVRGLLAGRDRLGWFAWWFVIDGVGRLVTTVALVIVGTSSPGAFAMAGAAPSIVAAVIVGVGGLGAIDSRRTRAGPPSEPPLPRESTRRMARTVAQLTVASVMLATLINGGAVAVRWLADDAERAMAAVFLTGLVTTRIPLLLFQTLQATLIGPLAKAVAAGRLDLVNRQIRSLLIGVVAVGVPATLAAALAGPQVLRIAFGEDLARLSATDLALQSTATFLIIASITLTLALISLGRSAWIPWGWLAGVTTMLVTLTVPADLFTRVGRALVLSGAVAGMVMWSLYRHACHEHRGTASERRFRRPLPR